jgi:hypothetical protein
MQIDFALDNEYVYGMNDNQLLWLQVHRLTENKGQTAKFMNFFYKRRI